MNMLCAAVDVLSDVGGKKDLAGWDRVCHRGIQLVSELEDYACQTCGYSGRVSVDGREKGRWL